MSEDFSDKTKANNGDARMSGLETEFGVRSCPSEMSLSLSIREPRSTA